MAAPATETPSQHSATPPILLTNGSMDIIVNITMPDPESRSRPELFMNLTKSSARNKTDRMVFLDIYERLLKPASDRVISNVFSVHPADEFSTRFLAGLNDELKLKKYDPEQCTISLSMHNHPSKFEKPKEDLGILADHPDTDIESKPEDRFLDIRVTVCIPTGTSTGRESLQIQVLPWSRTLLEEPSARKACRSLWEDLHTLCREERELASMLASNISDSTSRAKIESHLKQGLKHMYQERDWNYDQSNVGIEVLAQSVPLSSDLFLDLLRCPFDPPFTSLYQTGKTTE